jgi:hypothetical protein
MTRSREWVAPGLDNLMENPPGSKEDFLRDTAQFPPFDPGGRRGISLRVLVKKSHLFHAPIMNPPPPPAGHRGGRITRPRPE